MAISQNLKPDCMFKVISNQVYINKIFRLIIALVTVFNLKVIHLDTVNTFINTNIDKEVYITIPKGYKEGKKDIIFKL